MKCAARYDHVINPNRFWILDGFDVGFPAYTLKMAKMTTAISSNNAMAQYGIAAVVNSHSSGGGVSVINSSFKILP